MFGIDISAEEMKNALLNAAESELFLKQIEELDIKNNFNSSNTMNFVFLDQDAKVALTQLIIYLEKTYKNFTFTSIEDKKFHSLVKTFIKNSNEFNQFIRLIDVDFSYYIKLISFVIPEVFTHNLIKQIRTLYLKIDPKIKKK